MYTTLGTCQLAAQRWRTPPSRTSTQSWNHVSRNHTRRRTLPPVPSYAHPSPTASYKRRAPLGAPACIAGCASARRSPLLAVRVLPACQSPTAAFPFLSPPTHRTLCAPPLHTPVARCPQQTARSAPCPLAARYIVSNSASAGRMQRARVLHDTGSGQREGRWRRHVAGTVTQMYDARCAKYDVRQAAASGHWAADISGNPRSRLPRCSLEVQASVAARCSKMKHQLDTTVLLAIMAWIAACLYDATHADGIQLRSHLRQPFLLLLTPTPRAAVRHALPSTAGLNCASIFKSPEPRSETLVKNIWTKFWRHWMIRTVTTMILAMQQSGLWEIASGNSLHSSLSFSRPRKLALISSSAQAAVYAACLSFDSGYRAVTLRKEPANATQTFSNERTPTVYRVIPTLEFLIKRWETMAEQPRYSEISVALLYGVANLQKWLNRTETTSIAYFICMDLDPTIKDRYFRTKWDAERLEVAKTRMEQVVHACYETITLFNSHPQFDEYYAVQPTVVETAPAPHPMQSNLPNKNKRLVRSTELSAYLMAPLESDPDILHYWGALQHQPSATSQVARTPARNRLSPDLFEALQLLKSGYRNGHISAGEYAAKYMDALIAELNDQRGLKQSQSLIALQAEALSVTELCTQSKVDTRLENAVSGAKIAYNTLAKCKTRKYPSRIWQEIGPQIKTSAQHAGRRGEGKSTITESRSR
ncbi:hypothetical protein GGX14DRAFT_405939 [Mycena pura]|uniref:Uncharacterized protein n=1 Tax=Mycena pura TaxID=153505 RepID=A0AAD6Y012_9AGAR|nr:hypothetical protein GGX14DRAFT_405939 [Mycena pura]